MAWLGPEQDPGGGQGARPRFTRGDPKEPDQRLLRRAPQLLERSVVDENAVGERHLLAVGALALEQPPRVPRPGRGREGAPPRRRGDVTSTITSKSSGGAELEDERGIHGHQPPVRGEGDGKPLAQRLQERGWTMAFSARVRSGSRRHAARARPPDRPVSALADGSRTCSPNSTARARRRSRSRPQLPSQRIASITSTPFSRHTAATVDFPEAAFPVRPTVST